MIVCESGWVYECGLRFFWHLGSSAHIQIVSIQQSFILYNTVQTIICQILLVLCFDWNTMLIFSAGHNVNINYKIRFKVFKEQEMLIDKYKQRSMKRIINKIKWIGITYKFKEFVKFQFFISDLKPIYLLNIIAPDRFRLPPGVEISYDEKVNLHAYKFSPRASNLNFPSGLVFRYCEYFPEEFSILITMNAGSDVISEEETIFSVIPLNDLKPKLGLELSKGKLRYFHIDRLTKKVQTVEYKLAKIFDGDWHTIIVSITGSNVNVKVDCGKNRMRKIRRAFPSFLSVRDTNIHIGNAKRKKTLFRVRFVLFLYIFNGFFFQIAANIHAWEHNLQNHTTADEMPLSTIRLCHPNELKMLLNDFFIEKIIE